MTYVLITLSLISIYFFLQQRLSNRMMEAVFLKTVASTGFLMTALVQLYNSDVQSGFSYMIMVGLFFGVLGDIWLGLKWALKRYRSLFTLVGIFCFGCEHLTFLIATWLFFGYTVPIFYMFIVFVVAIVASLFAILSGTYAGLRYRNFQGVAFVYAFLLLFSEFIFGLVAATNHFDIQPMNRMVVAGLFFILSNALVSHTYFGKRAIRPSDVYIEHGLYYLAQFIIASSIAVL